MSGSKRRGDHSGGGRGGNDVRNTPGGRGFGGSSSPPFPDNTAGAHHSGRSTTGAQHLGRSTEGNHHTGRRTAGGHHPWRDSTSPSTASSPSFQVPVGSLNSPTNQQTTSPQSGSSTRTAGLLFSQSITDLPSSSEITFGTVTPICTNAATSSPSSSHPEANRSPSLSPSPPRSPSLSPSHFSSDRPRLLPDHVSAPGILGPAALLRFLDSFKFPHQKCPYYKAELKKLEALGTYDLSVDFNHVLATDENLALTICDRQARSDVWLRRAADMFFNANGLTTKEGKITFSNLPKSLRKATDALTLPDVPNVWPNQLFKGAEEVVSCSFEGSEYCDALTVTLFKRLSKGESFRGRLTLDGILFMENSEGLQAIITQEPEIHENASDEDKCLDVRGFWPLIEPFFKWGEELPLYFEELKSELLDATPNDVSKGWFSDFIRFFPSFVSSMGRRNFECGLYEIVKEFHLSRSRQFKNIFEAEPMTMDWRDIAQTNALLRENYFHEYRNTKESTDKDGETGKVSAQKSTCKEGNPGTDARETEKGQDGTAGGKEGAEMSMSEEIADPEKVILLDDPFVNTTWSLQEFKRHNNQHPKGDFQDIDESEIYSSYVFPNLPKVIKQLLDACEMGGRFAGIWSAYKSARFDRRRLPPI